MADQLKPWEMDWTKPASAPAADVQLAPWEMNWNDTASPDTTPTSKPEALTPRNARLKKIREQTGIDNGGFTQVIPWQDELEAGMGTPIAIARRALSGEDSGKGVGERIANAFNEEHQNIQEMDKEYEAKHPTLSTVQNVVGGLGLLGPGEGMVVRGPQGVRALANQAPRAMEGSIAARTAKSAGIGGAAGFAYGSGEGDTADERVGNAMSGFLWGAGTGGAGQLAGEGLASLGSDVIAPIYRSFRNPGEQARVSTTRAMANDVASGSRRLPEAGLTPQQYAWAEAQGYHLGNIDRGGENVTGLADAVYQRSGDARNRLNDFIAERQSQQLPMTEAVIDNMLWSPGDVARRQAALRAGRARTAPLYDAAWGHPNSQAMWNEGLQQFANSDIGQQAMKNANKILLDEGALAGANRVRNPFKERPVMTNRVDPVTGQTTSVPTGETRMEIDPRLQEIGFQPNLQYWDAVKKGLDEVIEGERDGIKGLSPRGQRAKRLKDMLVNHLDDQTMQNGVSLYRRAREAAGAYLGEESASAAGSKLYKEAQANSRNLDTMRMQIGRWSPEEREAAAQSFLEALKDDMIGKARSAERDAGNVDLSLNFLKSEKQRRVAEALLGPQRMASLEAHNMVQRVMAYRNKALQGNSRTWLRALGDEALSPIAGAAGGALLSGTDPSSLTYGALFGLAARHGPRFVNNRLRTRIAPHIADELIGHDPATYNHVINTIANDQQLRNYLKLMLHPARLAAGQYGSR